VALGPVVVAAAVLELKDTDRTFPKFHGVSKGDTGTCGTASHILRSLGHR
jgi:hypothetical protein